MEEGLLYINAVARSKENTLLSDERLSRLFAAPTLSDAEKVLSESGYGGGVPLADPAEFEPWLKAEEEALFAFCKSAPQGTGLELFFLENDYHNLKCIFKGKYAETDVAGILKEGTLPLEKLEEVKEGKLDCLSSEAREAVEGLLSLKGKKGARRIDCLFDVALSKERARRAKKCGSLIEGYFRLYADTANLDAYLRTVRVGGTLDFFLEGFLEGGELAQEWFATRFERGAEGAEDAPYPKLVAAYRTEGITGFERERENALLSYFKTERYDMFTSAPLAGYYLAKSYEIRTVCMALTCVKNGVSSAEMNLRKRDSYA